MKIALVAPIEETVPPKKYGGVERIVSILARELSWRGHDVALFATKDSEKNNNYHLTSISEFSIRSNKEFSFNAKIREAAKWDAIATSIRILKKTSYDIVHNHSGWRFLTFSSLLKKNKIVTTHHGPLSLDYQNYIYNKHSDLNYVSISNSQRKDLPSLNYIDTVYNSVDTDEFPFVKDNKNSDYMVFLARMSPEKNAIEAAKVAHMLKKKLIVAAKVDLVDQAYFEKFKPYIDNKYVFFKGELSHQEILSLLQNAKCLLVPIDWEEPFGLMFIEAMSCGTPVITYARGAAPEIVVDNKTGYLVNRSELDNRGNWEVKEAGIQGLRHAVEKLCSLPNDSYLNMRTSARKRVEEKFTVEKMVDGYEEVYKKILSKKS